MEKLLTDKEASEITGLSRAWFQRIRWSGGGPPYVKIGHSVRYRESQLESWINSHRTQVSTSQNKAVWKRDGIPSVIDKDFDDVEEGTL